MVENPCGVFMVVVKSISFLQQHVSSAIITDHLLFENWLDRLQMREDNIMLIILRGKIQIHEHPKKPIDSA